MRSVRSRFLNGFRRLVHGVGGRGAVAISAGLLALAPLSAQAEAITQSETLRWLVQLSGDSGQFTSTATAADYIQWARVKGMNPSGGWQPNAALSRDALAQILVQYFRISPSKRGTDYTRILEREGIIISGGTTISRAELVSVFGRQFSERNAFQRRHFDNDDDDNGRPPHGHDKDGDDDDDNGIGDGKGKGSPHKPPHKGKPPKPPKPPKNPKNHHDRPDNDD